MSSTNTNVLTPLHTALAYSSTHLVMTPWITHSPQYHPIATLSLDPRTRDARQIYDPTQQPTPLPATSHCPIHHKPNGADPVLPIALTRTTIYMHPDPNISPYSSRRLKEA
ncbi:hypothetical protein P3342_010048 [Pyrenophora teres f. teres]|nr:hypothetical protein P3342_010048 [Pyrenophora teres f. teres]